MLTLEQAKVLKYGEILIDSNTGKRWKVNGEVKTWKKPENAHRVQVPVKHGLYSYGYITELNLDYFVKEGS